MKIPESFKKSYKALHDSEWWRTRDHARNSAASWCRAPCVWAIAEQVLGANPAIHMYTAGAPFAGILYAERQRRRRRRSPS